ncbi:MAG: hypothetical protein ACNS62_14730 [Candidatus Cyclobacteriaceae bacterium M3_2C_046]
MSLNKREKLQLEAANFWYKLKNWEFWPWPLIYLPVFIYGIYLALKSRSAFFFSAANPGIETGGMIIESKYDILQKINQAYVPKTLFIKKNATNHQVLANLNAKQLDFPVMAKPNHGERGRQVQKIRHSADLLNYNAAAMTDFLIQEYIPGPVELGIFYVRLPSWSNGKITSVVIKEMLKVKGDGQSDILQLILQQPRSRLYLKQFLDNTALLGKIPTSGEEIELVPIGNHCKGATFLDGNHLITDELQQLFNQVSLNIPGFFYGRFDIRCASLEQLYQGKFQIMELNGAKSEPAHIYHPGNSLFRAYQSLFYHWRLMYKISRENRSRGCNYMSLSQGWKSCLKFHHLNRKTQCKR